MFDASRKVAPQPKRLHERDFGATGATVSVDGFEPDGASDLSALVACCRGFMKRRQP